MTTTEPTLTGVPPVKKQRIHGRDARDTILLLCVLCVSAVNSLAALPPTPKTPLPATERQELAQAADALAKQIDALAADLKDKPELLALLPDVRIYHKAIDWPLRYNEIIDVKRARAALKTAQDRIAQLKDGKAPWVTSGGFRAYVSKIDGSIQPYLLVVPTGYATAATQKRPPYRLDFLYHGRGENLTELNFISGKGEAPAASGEPHFTVYPYGRYCNANKFAGEIDTLEILDFMKKHYPIDENKVIEMGFSMGGAAAWHMAVHYTDLWCAASPGAGFAETRLYQHMDKTGEWAALPPYRKALFHLYDCPDWAWNLQMLPLIAYAGEIDPQQQSGDVMQKALEAYGLKLERIYGPKTAHKYEPNAKKDLDARLSAYAAKGRNTAPKEVHFETWTLRYNHMFWVTVDALDRHWQRARVDATLTADGVTVKSTNVAALTLNLPAGAFKPGQPVTISIDDKRSAATATPTGALTFSIQDSALGTQDLKKRHGLQGPIDDAFLDGFLIVKPSRPALNPKVEAWTKHELDYASTEWRKIFRGVAPEKSDTNLTDADIADNNLILFGDPSSNAVLAKIADKLPIKWTKDSITLPAAGKDPAKTFPADAHALIAIYPNPLIPKKYVVLNSGFTFRQADHGTNSRQVAKLPDWAVIDLNIPPDDKAPGAIPAAGFFDERWQFKGEEK
jgi:hypothetical protein